MSKWRALDGSPLWAERLGLAALGDADPGAEARPAGHSAGAAGEDGNGFDVGGVTQETMDAFSTRTAAVNRRFAELRRRVRGAVRARSGPARAVHAPQARDASRRASAKEQRSRAATRSSELAEWMRHARATRASRASSTLPEASWPRTPRSTRRAERRARRSGPARSGSAVAEVQRQNATWTRAKLLLELYAPALPGCLPAPTRCRTSRRWPMTRCRAGARTSRCIRIAPVPDVVDTSRLDHRKDGTSVYRPPGEERFVTRPHLDAEEWILRTAISPVPQRVTEAAAAARRWPGTAWTTTRPRRSRAS